MPRLAQFLSAAVLTLGVAASSKEDAATEIGRLNDESLLWGPYKPNLYFGVRPRLPKGLWTSLMWASVSDYETIGQKFRYTCEQGEDIHGYGWDEYDARTGGVQTIHDEGNGIDITTSFVKIPGGSHGGSWAARIKGEPRADAPQDLATTVVYYIAKDDGDGDLEAEADGTSPLGFTGDVTFLGRSDDLGDFSLVVTEGKGENPPNDHAISEQRPMDVTLVNSVSGTDAMSWQGRQVMFLQLRDAVDQVKETIDPEDPPPAYQVYRIAHKPAATNIQLVQKTFKGAFEFDVIFSSGSAGNKVTPDDVTQKIKDNAKAFADRFARVFDIKAPFGDDKYQRFGKSMFSNLLGGVGYFYGKQIVDRSYAPEYEERDEGFWEDAAMARARNEQQEEGPFTLFTSIPSRPFFPRGFLWDEGFHLEAIADWDTDLTLQIVQSWFSLMDDDGWIAREQILGLEARSKVPAEFQVQYPHYANPPTLFLVIEAFMERLRASNASDPSDRLHDASLYTAHLQNPVVGEEYLRQMYPLLRRQYDWFRKTQRGEIRLYDREAYSSKEAYRWRGRTETHILTSGIDDYPRAQPPHPGELHVDLMSWVGLMAKSLINIAQALGNEDDVQELQKNLDAIEHNLNDLHWSEAEGCYCDATIDDFEEHTLVCHKGYISIFPFLLGLMKPDDPKLGKILDLISDEEHIWSPHGLRSLSKQDPYYGTGENYWRSPVWMPINYLAVSQLKNTATQDGPNKARARDLYNRLRRNLVDTVYKSWEETGFAWEQYNPDTGAGQRTQHFTGWTSLVVKIMAMEDMSESHVRDEL